jgi:NAD(P)H-hydrate epimerase
MTVQLPPALAPDAHKGDAGRCLLVAGSPWMPGAALLAARAAQRAGAGLVTVGCLDAALVGAITAGVPEAVFADLFGPDGGAWDAAAGSAHALLVGPGLGQDAATRAAVERLLALAPGTPRVLDADALNVLDGEPERVAASAGPAVVTPHPGEAARLLGHAVPADEEGRADCARTLARRTGAVVCLKGRGTVVTDGDELFVNPTGNAGMATAGAGDVLAGILTAYLARRAALGGVPDRAEVLACARAAVHVHGAAGDLAADRLGPRAVVASDLVDDLARAQRELEPR